MRTTRLLIALMVFGLFALSCTTKPDFKSEISTYVDKSISAKKTEKESGAIIFEGKTKNYNFIVDITDGETGVTARYKLLSVNEWTDINDLDLCYKVLGKCKDFDKCKGNYQSTNHGTYAPVFLFVLILKK